MPNHLGAGSYEKEDCRTREQHQKTRGWMVGRLDKCLNIYIYIWDPIYIYTFYTLFLYLKSCLPIAYSIWHFLISTLNVLNLCAGRDSDSGGGARNAEQVAISTSWLQTLRFKGTTRSYDTIRYTQIHWETKPDCVLFWCRTGCRLDLLELQSNNSADGFRHVYLLFPFLDWRTSKRDCEVLFVFSSVSSFSFLSFCLWQWTFKGLLHGRRTHSSESMSMQWWSRQRLELTGLQVLYWPSDVHGKRFGQFGSLFGFQTLFAHGMYLQGAQEDWEPQIRWRDERYEAMKVCTRNHKDVLIPDSTAWPKVTSLFVNKPIPAEAMMKEHEQVKQILQEEMLKAQDRTDLERDMGACSARGFQGLPSHKILAQPTLQFVGSLQTDWRAGAQARPKSPSCMYVHGLLWFCFIAKQTYTLSNWLRLDG